MESNFDMLHTLLPELIEHVLSYLPASDIVHVSRCSRYLQNIAFNEHLWEKYAHLNYGVDLHRDRNSPSKNTSVRLFVLLILDQYGKFLSSFLRKKSFRYFGGLAKLFYYDWCLYLVELKPFAFPRIEENLQCEFIFKLYIGKDNKVEVSNFLPFCNEPMTICVDDKYLCVYSEPSDDWRNSQDYQESLMQRADRFIARHPEAPHRFEEYLMDICTGQQIFTALNLRTFVGSLCPIQPGLFKGCYAGHGTEIINLFYEDDGKTITGLKILGDPNVPSGEISFQANMCKPLNLTRDMQSTLVDLCVAMDMQDETDISAVKNDGPQNSPFRLPQGFDIRGISSSNPILDKYVWRFSGSVQLAVFGFENPSFVDANLVIFSEDIFGILILELARMNMFYRVKEDVLASDATVIFPDVQEVFNDIQ